MCGDLFRGDLSPHLASCDSQFMTGEMTQRPLDHRHKSILGSMKGIIGQALLFSPFLIYY